jgi:hypothetical protein
MAYLVELRERLLEAEKESGKPPEAAEHFKVSLFQ